jgi:hypothetical protein
VFTLSKALFAGPTCFFNCVLDLPEVARAFDHFKEALSPAALGPADGLPAKKV